MTGRGESGRGVSVGTWSVVRLVVGTGCDYYKSLTEMSARGVIFMGCYTHLDFRLPGSKSKGTQLSLSSQLFGFLSSSSDLEQEK